jgi:GT2 family glycosyltransferase
MRYQLFDLDVAQALSDLMLQRGDTGAAILVRRRGVPIGFWMQSATGECRISEPDLAQRIGREVGSKIVAEAIREELQPIVAAAPLPLVTIAICTRDRPAGVDRLLAAVFDAERRLPAQSAGLDVLIVDNAPSDHRTRDLVARRPSVRYGLEPRPGLNFARNHAIREARGELLIFVDDDVVPDRGWLEGLAVAAAENPDAAAYTGQVLPLELETEAQVIFERRGGFRRGFDRIRYGPVMMGDRLYPGGAGNFGAGANMAFRVAVLRRLGGFDEALDTGAPVPGGGDLDIFYRIIRSGYAIVYEPRFLVFHQHRRDMAGLSRQYRRSWGLGFMCYLVKCFRTDRERRVPLVRLMIWWFNNHIAGLIRQVRRKQPDDLRIPLPILIGELWGGIVGLCGGYGRSERRVARIRQQFP